MRPCLRLLPVVVLLFAAVAPAASAAPDAAPPGGSYRPGEDPPGACRGTAFSDAVGTLGGDLLPARPAPQRVYGLTGDDWLLGSPTRATCLFGGRGDDMLTLGRGGGVALGENGADVLAGSNIDDGLSGGNGPDVLAGAGGADILRGGRAVDGFDGGPGDDLVDSADGRGELVVCGPGTDTAVSDAIDVLVGCERRQGTGPRLRHKRLLRETGGSDTIFRMRFVVPQAAGPGGYRVLLAGGCGGGDLREVARIPAAGRSVEAGQETRFGIAPPAGGWCRGAYAGTLVRAHECPPGRRCRVERPVEPIALITFDVR